MQMEIAPNFLGKRYGLLGISSGTVVICNQWMQGAFVLNEAQKRILRKMADFFTQVQEGKIICDDLILSFDPQVPRKIEFFNIISQVSGGKVDYVIKLVKHVTRKIERNKRINPTLLEKCTVFLRKLSDFVRKE